MKSIKMVVLAISLLGIVFGLTPQVFAGGAPAPGDECCVAANPGKAALAFKATMGLVYDAALNHNLDVTLRLTRSGNQNFFRLNLTGIPLRDLTDEEILCIILNPANTNDPRVAAFVQAIKTAFNLSSTTKLVITAYSISDYMGVYDCDDGTTYPVKCYIPGTTRASTLGDLIIYAVESDKFEPLYPSCQ